MGGEGGREVLSGALECCSCDLSFRVREGLPDLRLPSCFQVSNTFSRWLYNLYAPLYDRLEPALAKLIWPGFSETELRREIASFLDPGPGDAVLEVCVGTGGNLPYIRAKTHGLLAGLDISEEMLRICARKVRQLGLGPVHLFLGCAEYLPFAPGTFDRVLIGGGISYFSDVRRALSEAARVAVGGGLVVVFEQVTLLERVLGRADLPLRHLPPGLRPLERRWLFGRRFYLLKFEVRC